jgi:anti-sigma regulatory factor (Ser/Thr protein kinase)
LEPSFLVNATKPTTLGLTKSFGFGDRLGLATPGHLSASNKYDFAPVFAQQSIREMARTQRTPEEVMRGVDALQEFARRRGLPDKTIFGLALALEESACNIVNHALQRDARQKFQIVLQPSNDSFTIELRDRGPAFDPTAAPQHKPQAEDDDVPGGWGIELVRRNIDDIRYTRASGENVLQLIKRLPPQTGANQPS